MNEDLERDKQLFAYLATVGDCDDDPTPEAADYIRRFEWYTYEDDDGTLWWNDGTPVLESDYPEARYSEETLAEAKRWYL